MLSNSSNSNNTLQLVTLHRNVRRVIKMLITKKKERRKEWGKGRKERRKEESKRRSPRTVTIPQFPGNPLSLALKNPDFRQSGSAISPG